MNTDLPPLKHKTSIRVAFLEPGDIIRTKTVQRGYGGSVRKYPDDPTEGWFRVTQEWIDRRPMGDIVQMSDGTHERFIK